MPSISTWTASVKSFNQDAVATGDRVIAVADGVTPLVAENGSEEQVSAYAQAVVDEVVAGNPTPTTIRSDIAAALERAAATTGKHGAQTTLSVVVWDDSIIVAATIGDSPVLVKEGTHLIRISDPQFDVQRLGSTTMVKQFIDQGMDFAEASQAATDSTIAARRRRNGGGGIWIPADDGDPQAIVHYLNLVTIPRHIVDCIVTATDGLTSAVDDFGILTDTELVDTMIAGKADELIAKVYKLCDDDPQKSRYPRSSDKDDATAATIIFK